MEPPSAETAVFLRTQQLECLAALVQVGRDLRAAVVAGDLGSILDQASEHEHLVARLDQVEGEIQRLPDSGGDPDGAAALAAIQARGAVLLQELSALLAENRLLLHRAQERAAFRLHLLTGRDRGSSLVDRRA